jgi:hypothetical protein
VFKLDEASRLWLKTKQEPLETQASQPSIAGGGLNRWKQLSWPGGR